MRDFSVTFERFNDDEAQRGGTNRYGFVAQDLTLREALQEVRGETSSASSTASVWADCSALEQARWVSCEIQEWGSGDNLTLSIHFPRNTTNASRARLARILGA